MMDWMSKLWTHQPENAIDRGNEALKYFHNWSLGNFADKYLVSFEELKEIFGGKHQDMALANFGDQIIMEDMSASQVEDAMRSLAMASKGNVPHQTVFYQALGNKISNLSAMDYVKATPQVALESILDVTKGVQSFGNTVITTAKIGNYLLPAVVIGAGLFIIFHRTKQAAGAK